MILDFNFSLTLNFFNLKYFWGGPTFINDLWSSMISMILIDPQWFLLIEILVNERKFINYEKSSINRNLLISQ